MKHIADTMHRLTALSSRRKFVVLIGVTLVYAFLFYPLFLVIAGSAITPSLLLVILTAHLFGIPGGLTAGFLAVPLNALLLFLTAGDTGLQSRDFWFVHLALFGIGFWTGYMEALRSRLQAELAQRHQVDQSLQESQQMLRLIMDHIPQAIFWKDRDLNYLGCNREFADDAGLDTPDKIIGQNDFAMPWLDQAELYRSDDQRVLQSGESKLYYEEPQTTPGGEQIWLRTSKVPMRNTDGQVIAVLGMYEDITERKQGEEALAKRNRTLQALQQGVLDIAAELDVPTLLQRIMERALTLLDADRGGAVYLYDSEKNVLRLEKGVGINEGREGIILHPGQGVMGVVLQTSESLIVNNYTTWEGRTKVLVPDPPSAMLGVPLLIKEQVTGALGMVADSSRRTFDAQDAHLAEAFAGQAAIALENARLYTAAQTEIAERKQAEAALREAQQRYRALFERTNDAVFIMSLDSIHMEVNQRAADMLGYTIEEMVGKPATYFVAQEEIDDAASRRDAVFAGETIPIYERTYRRKDGSTLVGEINVAMVYDDQGNPSHFHSVVRDVTERKRMEAELRASEERYRQLFEGIDDVILVHDVEANVLAVNEAACRRLGYTREELLQMKTTDINAPSYAEGFEERLARQLKEGGLAKISGVDITKDGRQIPVDVNTKTITYQGKTAILALARDITELKAMEEALRESEAVLTEAQRIGRIGNWVNTLGQEEVYWSDELFYIFGQENQPITADLITSWVHPDDQASLLEAAAAYLAEKSRLDVEFRCIRPDGEIRYLHSQGEVICDDTGEPIKTVGTVQDVTDRRLAAEHRFELELERGRVDALRQFIGDINHDLMTPITTMKTGFYLLGRFKDDPEKREEQLQRMRIQIDQLQERIQAMLNMLRLDATRAEELVLEPVDINAFVSQMVDVHRPVAAQKHQQLLFQSCPHGSAVRIEGALVSTALSHLIDNAMIHTAEKGTISVTIECNEQAVIVAVADTGEGIGEEDLTRIFERFYRKESFRPLTSGVGLGLPITRRIAELHGGRLEAESVLGQGSTFRIWLPKRLVIPVTEDT